MPRRSQLLCRTWTLLALSTVMTCVSATAMAQPEDAPPAAESTADAADEDEAGRLNREGMELGNKGEWREALAKLDRAWSLRRSYDIAGNLGLAELRTGHYREAAEHLEFAVGAFPANGKPEHRELLAKALAEALVEVGRVVVRIDPEGASVRVDGRSVGRAPLDAPIMLDPGEHQLEASFEGGVARQDFTVTKGQELELALTVTPAATSDAGSEKSPIVIGVGLGLGAVAVGLGFALAAGGHGDDAEELRTDIEGIAPGRCPESPAAGTPCGDLVDALESRDTLSNLSMGAFVAGGVLLVATGVYALWPTGGATEEGARLVPTVGPGHAGATFTGAF